MELLKVMTDRRSIRRFKPDVVPEEMIRELLDAARLAPSGGNCQPWRFVVIKSQSCKERLAKVVPQPFATQAPLIIATCVDKSAMSGEYLKQKTEELFKDRSFLHLLLKSLIPTTTQIKDRPDLKLINPTLI